MVPVIDFFFVDEDEEELDLEEFETRILTMFDAEIDDEYFETIDLPFKHSNYLLMLKLKNIMYKNNYNNSEISNNSKIYKFESHPFHLVDPSP